MMAYLDITDAAGNHLRYELPAEEGTLLTLGCSGDASLHVEGEGVAAHHASITVASGQYAIAPAEGAVMMNGAAIESAMLLVEGVSYAIGSLHLSLCAGEAAAEEAEAPAEEAADEATPRKTVRRRKASRSAASALAAASAVTQSENPLVTLVTPFYVIAVVAAAFVAGLTLRYWIVTGGFLPTDWLNK